MFRKVMAAVGWATFLQSVAILTSQAVAPAALAAAPKIAYLNVSDGTTALFRAAEDDAPANRSAIATVAPFPAFSWQQGPGEPLLSTQQTQTYLLFELHKAFLPYNIVWTAVRPAQGPYTMVMVGGRPDLFGFDNKVAGVALLDCGDVQESNVVFAFPTALDGNLHGIFVTAAQETAHSFGLEHTDDDQDIMHGRLGPAQWTFTDRLSVVSAPRECGPLTQNSHQKLLAVLGPWPAGSAKPLADGTIPDVAPPVLLVSSPVPAQTTGTDVQVAVVVNDESELDNVVFQTSVGSRVRTKPQRDTTLVEVFTLPPGPATIVVWARDVNGNQVAQKVDFDVVDPPHQGAGCHIGPISQGARPKAIWLQTTIFVAILVWGTCRRARW